MEVVGLVVDVQHLMTKTGRPWGKLTMEDYSGTHEFAMFGKDYENFRKYMFNEYYLFVRGRVQPRPYRKEGEPEMLEFKIQSMMQLSELRDTVQELTINVRLESLTQQFVDELAAHVRESQGKTRLRVNLFDAETMVAVNMFSRSLNVDLSQSLTDFLESQQIQYTIQ